MPVHDLDASAWVKGYMQEEGSQRVNAWMNQNPLVASAALGATEVLSTVVQKSRAGELTETERDNIVEYVWAEFDAFTCIALLRSWSRPVELRSDSVSGAQTPSILRPPCG